MQNGIILIIGTPSTLHLILGKPPYGDLEEVGEGFFLGVQHDIANYLSFIS